ncbi:MAG: hypothetical protein LC749_13525, partial [Actinobacteria bacterium]|nr:hypothetical protein [Actinomycetota bacterium]
TGQGGSGHGNLRTCEASGRGTGRNRGAKGGGQGGFPIYSFGEDGHGEVYVLTSTPTGKGIFRFAAK